MSTARCVCVVCGCVSGCVSVMQQAVSASLRLLANRPSTLDSPYTSVENLLLQWFCLEWELGCFTTVVSYDVKIMHLL